MKLSKQQVLLRYPLLVMGGLALLTGMWAGLLRLGWGWPTPHTALPISHGPLMVSGFLGTVIGIERAVALCGLSPKHLWAYLGPLLTGLGGLSLILGFSTPVGAGLITLGSLNLLLVFGVILRLQLASFTLMMAMGALLWFIGNILWFWGWPTYTVVLWWSGFLILTIAGERLELSRILRLSTGVQRLFAGIVLLFLSGLLLSFNDFDLGVRVAGGGLVAVAIWLLRYDLARYTVHKSDLARFIAICLLTGYLWLGIGGGLALVYGGVTAGFAYDAIQHAIFVGFVMSMIFGHAPIIVPAVLGVTIPFHTTFYAHLILLHLSLLVRVVGDLTGGLQARQWGGLLNVIAILFFVLNTVRAVRSASAQLSPQRAA